MTSYHVTLDGQGYIIDLASYRKGVANPRSVAPRTQLWHDWRGGIGFKAHDPAHADRYDTGALLDPTQGDLRLGRSLSSVYAPGAGTATDIYAIAVYQGALFAISGASGQVWTSSDRPSWSQSVDTG